MLNYLDWSAELFSHTLHLQLLRTGQVERDRGSQVQQLRIVYKSVYHCLQILQQNDHEAVKVVYIRISRSSSSLTLGLLWFCPFVLSKRWWTWELLLLGDRHEDLWKEWCCIQESKCTSKMPNTGKTYRWRRHCHISPITAGAGRWPSMSFCNHHWFQVL